MQIMNILKYSILLVILLKYVIASEKIMTKKYVIEALEEKGFVSIQRDWGKWKYCNDLFDHLITRNLDFIVGFLNQIKDAKTPTLAALFIKKPDLANEVLKRIEYDDNDLMYLTYHRPELAKPEFHDIFFKTIDMIKKPESRNGL